VSRKGVSLMEINELIKQYREMSGLSQFQAAKKLSIGASTLSKYENNNAQISIKMFVHMCKIYNIPKEVFTAILFEPESISRRKLIAKESTDKYDENPSDTILDLYKTNPVFFKFFQHYSQLPSEKQVEFIQMLKSFLILQR